MNKNIALAVCLITGMATINTGFVEASSNQRIIQDSKALPTVVDGVFHVKNISLTDNTGILLKSVEENADEKIIHISEDSRVFSSTDDTHPKIKDSAIINADHTPVRSKADANSHTIAVLDKGTQLPLKGERGDWVEVDTGQGTGYIKKSDVSGKLKFIANQTLKDPEIVQPPESIKDSKSKNDSAKPDKEDPDGAGSKEKASKPKEDGQDGSDDNKTKNESGGSDDNAKSGQGSGSDNNTKNGQDGSGDNNTKNEQDGSDDNAKSGQDGGSEGNIKNESDGSDNDTKNGQDGSEGNIKGEDASAENAGTDGESQENHTNGADIVSYALQFVGNPYVWGGTSLTDGADCSGFVQSVYAAFGHALPRTSREQACVGTSVSTYDIQPGDLLFYASDGYNIGHVAIYMGDGQIVHASTPETGIKVSRYDYEWPVKAVRIV